MRSKALLALAVAVFALKILGLPILHASGPTSATGTEHHAVLLELFTSEGCSSCPPADAFLKALDTPATWTTSKSSPWKSMSTTGTGSAGPIRFPRTIGAYGKSDTRDPYTPQLVVNGRSEVVASSARDARPQIIAASKVQRLRFIFRWRAWL